MNSEKLLESLKKVNYPGFSRDIVSFGLVNEAKFDNGKAHIKIELTSTDPKLPLHLKSQIEEVLGHNEEITETDIATVKRMPIHPQAMLKKIEFLY